MEYFPDQAAFLNQMIISWVYVQPLIYFEVLGNINRRMRSALVLEICKSLHLWSKWADTSRIFEELLSAAVQCGFSFLDQMLLWLTTYLHLLQQHSILSLLNKQRYDCRGEIERNRFRVPVKKCLVILYLSGYHCQLSQRSFDWLWWFSKFQWSVGRWFIYFLIVSTNFIYEPKSRNKRAGGLNTGVEDNHSANMPSNTQKQTKKPRHW